MTTLAHLLHERAAQDPQRTFLFFQEQMVSYQDFVGRTARAAAWLAAAGVAAGQTVAIMMANQPDFLYTLFACWHIGAIACPINPALTGDEASYIITNAGARLVVVDQERPLEGAVQVRTPLDSDAVVPDIVARPQDVASLIYTSGTTGHPKGVMLSHANYLWDTRATLEAVGLSPTDRFLGILPLFHVNAQVVTTLAPLMAGAQMVLLPRFSPDTFLHDVARYRATAFSAVPTVYALLLARGNSDGLDLSSLRFGVCGAAPMPVDVFERFEARFHIKILEGYGLSEATCVSSVNPINGARKIGSIGLPLAGQKMALMDDAGQTLPDGEVGEIVVSGPNVMQGYWDNPEATRAALRDGWLHTGDLGVCDPDGYFTIVGRKKDMIIRGGENIYPKEVEEVLHRHPAVAEAVVLGLPDPVWGETVAAVLVTRQTVEVAAINDWCTEHLAPFKRPVRIVLAEAGTIPRTATGKVQKGVLRDRLLQPQEAAT